MKKIYTLIFLFLIILSCSNRGNDKFIEATGTIETTDVAVSTKIAGDLESLFITEGESVKKGDTLAIIDHSTLDLQLKQAQAGVSLAQAQLNLLLKGARIEDIEKTEAALIQAEAQLKTAKKDFARVDSLLAEGAATQKQKDDAEARLTIAQAQYDTAKQMLKKIRKFARPEEIQSARAKLSQAEATTALIRKQISDCYITAPISGIITAKPYEEGELLGRGSVITTISDQTKVNLMIYVTELELAKVHLGQKAEVTIDAYPHKIFDGKVVYISQQAEFTPKNVQTKEDRVKLVFGVKLEIENSEGILKAGMPADAKFPQ